MSEPGETPAPAAAIERAAAEWFFRRDRGLDEPGRRALAAWRAADPRHEAAWRELVATWADMADAQPRARAPRRSRLLWLAAPLAAAAAIALALWVRASRENETAPASFTFSETDTATGRRVELPDGSVVRLNRATQLAWDFSAARREVRLARGEAHFEVAKDAARPFVVRAGGVAVRAVGTAFNVRLDPAAVAVLVTEGRVRLENTPAPAAPELAAGEQAVVAAGTPAVIRTPPPAEVAAVLAWQPPRLEFADTPLAEIVAAFNRHNRHQLVVADAALAARKFGGAFPADDHEAFVRLLERTFGVRAERTATQTVLRP